jgi:hypothetical protein
MAETKETAMGTRLDTALKYVTLRLVVRYGLNIGATYNGLPRLLSPHLLGSKQGERRLFSYQFGGQSKSGLHPVGSPNNLRCMRVSDLQGIIVIGGEWHTGKGGGTSQGCIDQIDVSFEPREREAA